MTTNKASANAGRSVRGIEELRRSFIAVLNRDPRANFTPTPGTRNLNLIKYWMAFWVYRQTFEGGVNRVDATSWLYDSMKEELMALSSMQLSDLNCRAKVLFARKRALQARSSTTWEEKALEAIPICMVCWMQDVVEVRIAPAIAAEWLYDLLRLDLVTLALFSKGEILSHIKELENRVQDPD